MPIHAVILDYGNVLCPHPPQEDFEILRKASGIEAGLFYKIYWDYRDAYDRGMLDGHAYWQRIATEAGGNFSSELIAQLIKLDFQLWVRPQPVLLEWSRLLSQRGVKMAVLSNMPYDFSAYLRQRAKWLAPFSELCFSGELKMGKPDPGIYQRCLEALGVPAPEALFLDDREVNVAGARAVGLNGLLFQSIEQLRVDLEPFGLASSLAEATARVG